MKYIDNRCAQKITWRNALGWEVIIIESKHKKHQCASVLQEIKYLRGMEDFVIDSRNSNRYLIKVKEREGHTAYCFSSPIYNIHTKKLVLHELKKEKTGGSFQGTNALVSICQNRCVFENREGRAVIYLKESPALQGSTQSHNVRIVPTLNGMRFVVKGNRIDLTLQSDSKQEGVRFSPSCLSIMNEKFKPFITVAALYASNANGAFSPLEMSYKDKGDGIYDVSIFHEIKNGTFTFEVNLYEAKLFQDTTVESFNPDSNNVYGAIGFVGKTKKFGVQWLYSRPDFSKIPDLASGKVEKALLHIPIMNGNSDSVDVFIPKKRFCSFGSTWNTKIDASPSIGRAHSKGRYLTIDVTDLFTNRKDQTLAYNEGIILKKPKNENGFVAISTADCYSAPQILEIKFKK